MPLPRDSGPRLFYRVAYRRLEEAEVLFRWRFNTGSVYLAGYSIECMLKSLILSSVPKRDQESTLQEFRGSRAHDFKWLWQRYVQTSAPPLGQGTRRALLFVSTWEVDLRYNPKIGNRRDASRFLEIVRRIVGDIDNRLG